MCPVAVLLVLSLWLVEGGGRPPRVEVSEKYDYNGDSALDRYEVDAMCSAVGLPDLSETALRFVKYSGEQQYNKSLGIASYSVSTRGDTTHLRMLLTRIALQLVATGRNGVGNKKPWMQALEWFDGNRNGHIEYYEAEGMWNAAGLGRAEREGCLGLKGATRLAAYGSEGAGEAEVVSLNVSRVAVLMEGMLMDRLAGCVKEDVCGGQDAETVWGYTMLSVALLTLVAGLLVIVVPLFRIHTFFSEGLLSLAIGALLGDTLYHLVPAIMGRHHVEPGHAEHITEWALRVRTTILLLTILAFYCIAYLTRLVLASHPVSDEPASNPNSPEKGPAWNEWVPLRTVRTLAWVCVVADGFHNLTDGLAIGASFHKSTSMGVATSTAVALHEIPQEVADFALLLRAGMSPLQAVLFNFLSSVPALLGAVVSCAVGGDKTTETYMLSVTAGSFIYLAVGIVGPELLGHGAEGAKGWRRLAVHTAGMAVGCLVMWLVAHHEDEHECGHH